MDRGSETRISKFLSHVLRHRPDAAGIDLDEHGWTDVSALLAAAARQGHAIGMEELAQVVTNNDKQRFAFNADRTRIRASQGHSVEVELAYRPSQPPDVLFHGTVERFLGAIRESGLLRGERHHVHLSKDEATAINVGTRRGKPVLLRVDSAAMHRDGHAFFLSDNGVWLAERVPPQYLTFP